jgi:hypothetical protein
MPHELFGPWTRRRRVVWALLAVAACLVFGGKFVESLRPPPTILLDFFQEYASARNYREGLPIYAEQTATAWRYLDFNSQAEENNPFFFHFNAHPPASVLLALPLGGLSYSDAFLAWNVLTFAAIAASFWIAVRQLNVRFSPWSCLPLLVLLLVSNLFRQQFNQGQLNAFLLLLITGAWAADRSEKPWLSGALLGTATAVKLFPGFLFLYPVCRGQWRPVVSGVVAFFAVNGVALALLGPETYADYYRNVLPHLGVYRDVWLNSSLSGYWHKLFDTRSGHNLPLWHAPALAQFATVASCTTAVLIVAFHIVQARSRRQKDLAFGLTLNGMLLVSPITWDHYFLLVALPLLMLWLWVPRPSPMNLALQVILVVLSIGPKFFWDFALPGVGEREGQIATPWQTVVFLSYLLYAQVALFGLVAALIARSARATPRRGSPWLPLYRFRTRFAPSSSTRSAR